jgi:hypothetical protein
MVGAGAIGSIIGLQAGLLFWLLQRLSGETVEARWAREFAYSLNRQALEAAKLKDKDARKELLIAQSDSGIVKEEEGSDWRRSLVMKLRSWAIAVGLLTEEAEDDNYKDDER